MRQPQTDHLELRKWVSEHGEIFAHKVQRSFHTDEEVAKAYALLGCMFLASAAVAIPEKWRRRQFFLSMINQMEEQIKEAAKKHEPI